MFENLKSFWQFLSDLLHLDMFIFEVVGILFLTLVVDTIARIIIKKIGNKLKKHPIAKSFVDGATTPTRVAIWLYGTTLVLTTILTSFHILLVAITTINSIKSSIIVLLSGWYVIIVANYIEVSLKNIAKKDDRFDETTVEALIKIVKLIAFVVTGFIVLSAYGADLTGLLAFGGIGGLAVGFAAKDLLGNLFGGLVLYLDKPFKIGDWVRSPDREIEGTVETIGWRVTIIRTFDKRPLYIPNGIFSTIVIENPSRMSNRRIKETIGIRYCDMKKVSLINEEIKNMLYKHPEIDQNKVIIVNLLELSESSLNIMVYALTKTIDWVKYHKVKEDILLLVANIIEKNGAETAFPTRTLYMNDNLKDE